MDEEERREVARLGSEAAFAVAGYLVGKHALSSHVESFSPSRHQTILVATTRGAGFRAKLSGNPFTGTAWQLV